jgi:hypothetical protein
MDDTYAASTNGDGILRFKRNQIVSYLLDFGDHDMNQLATMQSCGMFTEAEWRQFYRLIGYSVGGYLNVFPDDAEAGRMFDEYQKLLHGEREGV